MGEDESVDEATEEQRLGGRDGGVLRARVCVCVCERERERESPPMIGLYVSMRYYL